MRSCPQCERDHWDHVLRTVIFYLSCLPVLIYCLKQQQDRAFCRGIVLNFTVLWRLYHRVIFGFWCRQISMSHYHSQADKVGQALESTCCHFWMTICWSGERRMELLCLLENNRGSAVVGSCIEHFLFGSDLSAQFVLWHKMQQGK